jgi:hypothetical protein
LIDRKSAKYIILFHQVIAHYSSIKLNKKKINVFLYNECMISSTKNTKTKTKNKNKNKNKKTKENKNKNRTKKKEKRKIRRYT